MLKKDGLAAKHQAAMLMRMGALHCNVAAWLSRAVACVVLNPAQHLTDHASEHASRTVHNAPLQAGVEAAWPAKCRGLPR
jgi:hypothetical protein